MRMRGLRFPIMAALVAATCLGGNPFARANDGVEAPTAAPSETPFRSDINLEELITGVVENHPRLLSARAQVEAARERSIEAIGAWYPQLDITANIERYRLKRSQTATNILPAQEASAEITQLLWDFGAANAAIERARLEHVQSEINLVQVRQELTAEALSAYINLIRAAEVAVFAQRSEENIRRQTGLEEARIEAGSGLSTDLLQAKTQLAGAQARRVDSEGTYEIALNRYRAVFGAVPETVDALPGLDVARDMLPPSLDEGLQEAFRGNPQLRAASIDVSLATQDRIATTISEFAPTFEVIGSHSTTVNSGGTIRRDIESSIMLEMSFPFNLGFVAINTLRAADADVVASSETMGDLGRSIEERFRNAWKQLETSTERAGYLFDQAGIAQAFLEVALQERQLGQRSLIDILSGETALINAQSDAISAEADVLLAVVELLASSGGLFYSVIETVPRPDRSAMLAPIAGLQGPAVPDPTMQLLLPPGTEGGVLDPSLLLAPPSGDGTITPPPLVVDPLAPTAPPPASTLQPPTAQPQATEEAPVLDPSATLAPETLSPPAPEPPPNAGTPPANQGGGSLADQLQSTPSFDDALEDALPRPEPPPPPSTPRVEADPAQDPSGPADLAPAPDSPPESTLEVPEPSAPDDGAVPGTDGGAADTELDNPLFEWAQ
jgi:TolC family type I secretion outer membrane protein